MPGRLANLVTVEAATVVIGVLNAAIWVSVAEIDQEIFCVKTQQFRSILSERQDIYDAAAWPKVLKSTFCTPILIKTW